MSLNNFLSYLQQLLSMVDPANKYSVALAQAALDATVKLVRASGKADAVTMRTMVNAQREFRYLASHRDEFAGIPGDYNGNEQKRRRLGLMLQPGC